MNAVRLNITLPQDVAQQLDELVGPKRKSRFITETLRERIERIRKEQLQRLLEEGYQATRQESLAIAKEFEPVDLEGWDDY
jgi:metal-responsive CopG/Arc/MetJ family transcriptional regulator